MRFFIFSILLAAAFDAHSQANNYLDFSNITLSSPPDRRIRYSTNDPSANPFGTNNAPVVIFGSHTYAVQLYFGSTSDGEGSLQAVTNSPVNFRQSTTSSPGVWLGGFRTLNNFAPGQTANLQVRAWEPAYGTDYFSVTGGLRGKSSVFTFYIDPSPLAPPSATLMNGFQGFGMSYYVPIPTNTSATMSGLGFGSGGQFQFTVAGAAGYNYSVQVSTNLTAGNWDTLRTNVSPFSFTDAVSVLYTQRFYRAVFLP